MFYGQNNSTKAYLCSYMPHPETPLVCTKYRSKLNKETYHVEACERGCSNLNLFRINIFPSFFFLLSILNCILLALVHISLQKIIYRSFLPPLLEILYK